MKVVLTTLNAKYIHTSLALRWLYVANKGRFTISFREYTIKEDIRKIADELLFSHADVIGISVSIWNVSLTQKLIEILKKEKPELIIILGGPEVSYEPEYFLNHWPVDYVISGEGEFVLGELLECLEQGEERRIESVSSRNHISRVTARADLEKLSRLPSPYMLEEDNADRQNKLVYFESSRGCPYQCQYCLSSLEKGVRYFPEKFITDNLEYLITSNARQIKFLDRTFNLNKEHTRLVFDFLIANYRPNLSCQFEIYADLLSDETIEYLNQNLPRNFFRFEIGIQSTYEPTNQAVKRKQDFPLLSANIKKLMDGGKIDLHLDLIAGLPYETLERFIRSFNDVFRLKAKEVQLGFLKMLRGTGLRQKAESYGYEYEELSPYEIKFNSFISSGELQRIHDAEHMLEKYWNSGRFRETLNVLFESYYKDNYFGFFDQLSCFYKENGYPLHGYQLEDLFRYLDNFLSGKGMDLTSSLRTDYYANFSRRPTGSWKETLGKKERKKVLYEISQDKDFLQRNHLTRKIIEKQTAIDPLGNNLYLLTIFPPEGKKGTQTIEYLLREIHPAQNMTRTVH